MKIEILDNTASALSNSIKESLNWATVAHLGVAYASYAAFVEFRNPFQSFLRKNGRLRVLFDIEKFFTDVQIIEELTTIPGDSECKVYIKQTDKRGYYHPKFYLFYDNNNYKAIIGSSNFTKGGLFNNIECNLSICNKKDDTFNKLEDYFLQLWDLESSINVLNNSELLSQYSILYEKIKKTTNKSEKKFSKIKSKLYKESEIIIQSSKNILNEDFAYLLGLVSANSILNLQKNEIIIDLFRQKANAQNEFAGYYYYPEISDYKINQEVAHRKDIERISERLKRLLKFLKTDDQIEEKHLGGFHFQLHLRFKKGSPLLSEIKDIKIQTTKNNKAIPFVPNKIYESENKKIITAFLSGYCDLKSRMAASDGLYHTENDKRIFTKLRMGISFPHGQSEALDKFDVLFKKIGVKVSKTDPKKRTRENLIRIDVRHVPYELIGTHWRRIFLKDFQYFIDQKNKKYNLDLFEEEVSS